MMLLQIVKMGISHAYQIRILIAMIHMISWTVVMTPHNSDNKKSVSSWTDDEKYMTEIINFIESKQCFSGTDTLVAHTLYKTIAVY